MTFATFYLNVYLSGGLTAITNLSITNLSTLTGALE